MAMTDAAELVTPSIAPLAGQLTKRQVLVIYGALMLGLFLAGIDSTVVSTALPTIVGDLHSASHITWVVTAYLLTSTVTTPLWGKLGDLYGRKSFFQAAIVIFLLGSVLAGLSTSMVELIGFRAIQGIGGGGLIVGASAIVGDIVSPRDRGRYAGAFGATFAVSTVIGPMLGGLFTQYLSWRWVFYINIPIGILALIVTASVLPKITPSGAARVDYLGAFLLMAGATCLVLFTSLGGSSFAWGSGPELAFGLGGLALVALFVLVEHRASDPVIPPRLFKNRVFSATSSIGFVVGFAMFGAMTFIPLYFQLVRGVTPTMSGFWLLPMMLGMLAASVTSGFVVSRRGRYRIFPIVGTFMTALGLVLLSRITETTTGGIVALYELCFGVGIGMVMQILVLAVQNAVSYRDLGTATASNNFFRSIGNSFGVAAFGAIYAIVLPRKVASHGHLSFSAARLNQLTPAILEKLDAPLRALIRLSITETLQVIFLTAVPIALVAFGLSFLLPEVELRQVVRAKSETFDLGGAAEEFSSLEEAELALERVVAAEDRTAVYSALARDAGTRLDAQSAWLLFRVDGLGPLSETGLADALGVSKDRIERGLGSLEREGLVAAPDGRLELTEYGREVRDRLVEARADSLSEIASVWEPSTNPELAAAIRKLAAAVLTDDPALIERQTSEP
jgi:EmrB/QacA subfamily drug resistance transporter